MPDRRLAGWIALTAAAIPLVGCGSASSSSTPARPSTAPATASISATATPTSTTTTPRPRPRPTPSPGSLPQTPALPSADTQQFHSETAALWHGVQTDSVGAAMPAFFPQAAYVQVKQIGDPRGDWTDRLVGEYGLDIDAAHGLLRGGAAGAQLVRVDVPAGYAHWVDPGACYNGIGYWELPNARVVYREGGELHSFGIASMISWRGVWYVVHLGAVVRPGTGGVVDDPEVGTGSPQPSSTC